MVVKRKTKNNKQYNIFNRELNPLVGKFKTLMRNEEPNKKSKTQTIQVSNIFPD